MASTLSSASLTSLPVTLCQAITFLTRPLLARYPAPTVHRLQAALGANLTALYTPTWHPSEPLRGSGRRCLTFSPRCLPPRAVHNACKSSEVQWSEWIVLLGGAEFDMFVDPGCISIRVAGGGRDARLVTVWSEEMEREAAFARQLEEQRVALLKRQEQLARQRRELERGQMLLKIQTATREKTLAQQLLESDGDDEDELFSIVSDELRVPTYKTPLAERFPVITPKASLFSKPVPAVTLPSIPSRCDSPDSLSALSFTSEESYDSYESESDIDSIFSGLSLETAASSAHSSTSPHTSVPSSTRASTQEPAYVCIDIPESEEPERVFVDRSKREATPYDSGKTTVLTGGVMLGAPAQASKATGRWCP